MRNVFNTLMHGTATLAQGAALAGLVMPAYAEPMNVSSLTDVFGDVRAYVSPPVVSPLLSPEAHSLTYLDSRAYGKQDPYPNNPLKQGDRKYERIAIDADYITDGPLGAATSVMFTKLGQTPDQALRCPANAGELKGKPGEGLVTTATGYTVIDSAVHLKGFNLNGDPANPDEVIKGAGVNHNEAEWDMIQGTARTWRTGDHASGKALVFLRISNQILYTGDNGETYRSCIKDVNPQLGCESWELDAQHHARIVISNDALECEYLRPGEALNAAPSGADTSGFSGQPEDLWPALQGGEGGFGFWNGGIPFGAEFIAAPPGELPPETFTPPETTAMTGLPGSGSMPPPESVATGGEMPGQGGSGEKPPGSAVPEPSSVALLGAGLLALAAMRRRSANAQTVPKPPGV